MRTGNIVHLIVCIHIVSCMVDKPGFSIQPISYHVRNNSRYKITVQLVSFINPDHTKVSGKACDEKNLFRKDQFKCEHVFEFCTTKGSTSDNKRVCTQNQDPVTLDTINFDKNSDFIRMATHQLGGIEHYKGYGGKLFVKDDDGGNKYDFIDEFEIKFLSNETNTTKSFTGTQPNRKLEARVTLSCDKHYYGEKCIVYCKLARGNNCTCSSNGTLYCYIKDAKATTTNLATATTTVGTNLTSSSSSMKLRDLTNRTTPVFNESKIRSSNQASTQTTTTLTNESTTIKSTTAHETTTTNPTTTAQDVIEETLILTFNNNCSRILNTAINKVNFENALKEALSALLNGLFTSEQVNLKNTTCGSILVELSINVTNQTFVHQLIIQKINSGWIRLNLTIWNGNQTETVTLRTNEIAPSSRISSSTQEPLQSSPPGKSGTGTTKQPVAAKSNDYLAIGLGIGVPCAVIIIGTFIGVLVNKRRIRKSRKKKISTAKSLTYDNRAYTDL